MTVENTSHRVKELSQATSNEIYRLIVNAGCVGIAREIIDKISSKFFKKKETENHLYENIVYCPTPTTVLAEQEERTWRRRALREAFDRINRLIINTGKYPKVEAAMRIVQNLVAPNIDFANGNVIQLPSTKDEPALANAVEVSRFKAETARHEYIEDRAPELIFYLNKLGTALEHGLSDEIINGLLQGIIFLGADINAFVADGESGEVRQQHKLERQMETVLEKDFEDLKKELYETYVYPKTGRIRAVWQIASVTINGSMHHFSDWIEVIAKPIDKELLDKYLDKALRDGTILKSNTRLKLFEMLVESDGIQTIARLPNEMMERGYGFSHLRQSPKPEEIVAIQKSIITNAPVYVK